MGETTRLFAERYARFPYQQSIDDLAASVFLVGKLAQAHARAGTRGVCCMLDLQTSCSQFVISPFQTTILSRYGAVLILGRI